MGATLDDRSPMPDLTGSAPRSAGRATAWARIRSLWSARILLALLGVLVMIPTAAQAVTAADAAPVGAVGAPVPAPIAAALTAAGDEPVELTLFWGDGCPNCEAERAWLETARADFPNLVVTELEVWNDEANRATFVATGEALGFEAGPVPTTVLAERVWVGWTDSIQADLSGAITRLGNGETITPGVYGTPGAGTCTSEDLACAPEDEAVAIDIPGVGEVDLTSHSLFVSTLIIGFVDGVNPCSLWVISVLLTIVVRTADRRRVLWVGTTFLLVTAGMYALYMFGIYSVLAVASHLTTIQYVVAAIAGVFGLVSIKDYFAFKKGISFTISDSAKPGLYQRMRRAAMSKSLLPALGATVALGVVVSLLETPCTAGFPVLWTGLLHANNVGTAEAIGLFFVYMVPFLLDELIIFGIVVATMKATKMHEKHGQLLKLYAGVTMVALCAVMLIDPAIMENPWLALGLFVAAFALTAVIHAVTVRIRTRRGLTV